MIVVDVPVKSRQQFLVLSGQTRYRLARIEVVLCNSNVTNPVKLCL